MSLVYVIDAYNVIKHPYFAWTVNTDKNSINPSARNVGSGMRSSGADVRRGFIKFLQLQRLTGSAKNRVIVVFDGYPDASGEVSGGGVDVEFSRSESADERIRYLLDNAVLPKEIVVVSDDREVQFFARSAGATAVGVEDFIGQHERKKRAAAGRRRDDAADPKVNYSQMESINKELRKRWLK